MVTVSLEIVAVVAGLKSEYFTSGFAQPVKNTLKLRSKTVAERFMCGVGLTLESSHALPRARVDFGIRFRTFMSMPTRCGQSVDLRRPFLSRIGNSVTASWIRLGRNSIKMWNGCAQAAGNQRAAEERGIS